MSINSISDSTYLSTTYVTTASSKRGGAQFTMADLVSSQAGKDVAVAEMRGLENLKPISLDPAIHLEDARQRMGEILKGMGVSQYTPIDISRDAKGELTYTVQHDNAEQISNALQKDPQLNSSMSGAHAAMSLQMIAKARHGLFDNIPASDTSAMNQAINWVQQVAREVSGYSMRVSYNGGVMQGASLLDQSGNVATGNFTQQQFG